MGAIDGYTTAPPPRQRKDQALGQDAEKRLDSARILWEDNGGTAARVDREEDAHTRRRRPTRAGVWRVWQAPLRRATQRAP